ncbi:UNVERIFIED_CONTAM: hypothetical protein DES50_10545 [Williamsia faeni]
MTPRVAWPTFAGLWQCDLESVSLDTGEPVDGDQQYRVHLDQEDWKTATIEVVAHTNESIPNGVNMLAGYALISCTSTNTRIPFGLALDSDTKTRVSGLIELERALLRDTATLTVEIVANHNGRNRVVASSVPWTIVLRRFEVPPKSGRPPIAQVWADFSASDAPPVARKNTQSYAALDAGSDTPVLYLNSGLPGLQALLMSENAKLEKRRLRDLIGSQIARYTVTTLFRVAAAEVLVEDDDITGPSSPLLRQTCEAIANAIPHLTSVDELYESVARANGDRTATAELWANVDAAIDMLTQASAAVGVATEEVQFV